MPFKPETTSRFKPEQIDVGEPTLGEKAGALAYGGVTGLAGGLGELEKFGAYTVPEFLGFEEDQKKATLFPTVKDVETGLSKIGVKKPREEVGGYQTAGEILGGFGTSLPSMVRGGVKAVLGAPTATREAAAKTAEKLGFKLSPAQVRQAEPVGAQGATFFGEQNQKLANELASKGTGKQVKEIDDVFIRGRLKDLGKQFDKLYEGKVFNIDKDAVDALQQIRAMEAQLPGVATVSPVAQTADEIVKNFDRLTNRKGAIPDTFGIEGEALQRIRNALTERARGTSAANAREIYNLVDVIDASIAKNHKDVAKALDVIRPQYRNAVILEDLYKSGGIQGGDISLERLGNMLRTDRGVVRKTGQEIDELGKIGRDAKIRAMWESEGATTKAGEQSLKDALKTTMGVVPTVTGLRTRPARAVQRFYATEPTTKTGKILKGEQRIPGAAPTAAGTATRPLQTEE